MGRAYFVCRSVGTVVQAVGVLALSMPPCTVCWPGDLDIAQATLYDLLSRWVRHKPRADRDHAAFDLDDVLPRLTLKVMVGADAQSR